jgi:hypothetical protein
MLRSAVFGDAESAVRGGMTELPFGFAQLLLGIAVPERA